MMRDQLLRNEGFQSLSLDDRLTIIPFPPFSVSLQVFQPALTSG